MSSVNTMRTLVDRRTRSGGIVPSPLSTLTNTKATASAITHSSEQLIQEENPQSKISRMTASTMIMSRAAQRLATSKLAINKINIVRHATAVRNHSTNGKFAAKVCVLSCNSEKKRVICLVRSHSKQESITHVSFYDFRQI